MKLSLHIVFAWVLIGCASGSGSTGSGPNTNEAAPISGEQPPISGETPPRGSEPSGGEGGGTPAFRCGARYTCVIAGKTNTIEVECASVQEDGTVLDKKGRVLGKVANGPDGSFIITGTAGGQSATATCVPAT